MLLLRRGVHRTPAPQTPWRQRSVQTKKPQSYSCR
nr:MAG TPA: hypothetical protein [Caudoviricetes sp.]